MVKKTTLTKGQRRGEASNQTKARREKIAAAIAKLDQIRAPNAKVAKVIALFKSWLADESGYDEEAWPELKKALDMERKRAGARRLFNG
jgi:hypothetical protein